MHILSSSQVRQWDDYTIQHEPIRSVDLMERAALACAEWIITHYPLQKKAVFFCGKGNNGGDGLALARLLFERGWQVSTYILEFGHMGTDDFQANLARLHELSLPPKFISTTETIPSIEAGDLVIDALLGSGLNRPVEGLTAELVDHINACSNTIISIDIPSGLSADQSSKGHKAVKATETLAFQCYKPAFLVAENSAYIGRVSILDIGLLPEFIQQLPAAYTMVDDAYVRSKYKPRNEFSHKGNFGHALLFAGSQGKMGAAILCARACLRSGVGLLTLHVPAMGQAILQSTVPEAMTQADNDESKITEFSGKPEKFQVMGIGPGIDTHDQTLSMLTRLFQIAECPMILDADALNLVAREVDLLKSIKGKSVLTPHPKEFERLFGKSDNDFARLELLKQKAIQFQSVILLKGRFSCVATPDGKLFFNSSGNAGMGTGGAGDVLTGIITGLAAQGYSLSDAACMGMYLHGIAGDIAASRFSKEAMIAGDIIDCLPEAFKVLFGRDGNPGIQ